MRVPLSYKSFFLIDSDLTIIRISLYKFAHRIDVCFLCRMTLNSEEFLDLRIYRQLAKTRLDNSGIKSKNASTISP